MLSPFALLAGLTLTIPLAAHPAGGVTRAVRPKQAAAMVLLPTGWYRPLYAVAGQTRVQVAAFALDRDAITRGQFLDFVRVHVAWRRDSVRAVFADAAYLSDWRGALDAGAREELDRPVRDVSWFAAKAYCAAEGKRLPTVDEWEYAAAASATRRDASDDSAFRARLVTLYASRRAAAAAASRTGEANVYGVRGLHDLVWEWTLDFNSVVIGDDSRSAGSGADARDHHLYCASAAIGASDPSNYPAFMRHAVRSGLTPRTALNSLGFRCAAAQGV